MGRCLVGYRTIEMSENKDSHSRPIICISWHKNPTSTPVYVSPLEIAGQLYGHGSLEISKLLEVGRHCAAQANSRPMLGGLLYIRVFGGKFCLSLLP